MSKYFIPNWVIECCEAIFSQTNEKNHHTKEVNKTVQRCEVIFSQTNEKNYCISGNMESFFEAGLRKKNEQIEQFYAPPWY